MAATNPVYGLTFGALKPLIADAVGDLVQGPNATTGTNTTTLSDTVNLTDTTNTRLKGVYVYGLNGTGQGQETRSTAFTTPSITTPTQTASWATTTYMLTRRYSNTMIQNAIRRAIISLGQYGKPYFDQSFIFGSPVANGTFFDDSGTFPNGWTKTGTVTPSQESEITLHGPFSCKLTAGDASRCYYEQTIPTGIAQVNNQVSFRGWVNCTTLNAAFLEITDGVTTSTVYPSSATAGWGDQELVASIQMSSRATTLKVRYGIESSNSGVIGYFSGLWLAGTSMPTYALVGSPTSVHAIAVEYNWQNNVWGSVISNSQSVGVLEVVNSSTRKLRINVNNAGRGGYGSYGGYPGFGNTFGSPWGVGQGAGWTGRIMEIRGRQAWTDFSAQATSDDDTFDGNATWLINQAAAYLILNDNPNASADFQRTADKLKSTNNASAPAGSVYIQGR